MKARTIKKAIRAKVDEWINSIEDDNVRKLVKDNTIVTGGCIASMLLQEKVNDFDIYFKNKETTKAVAEYYIKKFNPKDKAGIDVPIYVEDAEVLGEERIRIVVKSAGIASEEGTTKPYQYFESRPDTEASQYVSDIMTDVGGIQDAYEDIESQAQETEGEVKYRPVFLSTNAITLSHRIQIIIRFFGDPDEIHTNYDFAHCTSYWTSWDNELVLRPQALEALLTKELRYVGSKYPLASVIRTRKFINRGFSITAGAYLKMIMQLNDLDLKNIEVLQDQLTGVDAAYFHDILGKLKEKDRDRVDTAYLIEIIDRLF